MKPLYRNAGINFLALDCEHGLPALCCVFKDRDFVIFVILLVTKLKNTIIANVVSSVLGTSSYAL